MTAGYCFHAGWPTKTFELRWSKAKNRPVVVVTDEAWDYEDEALAAELSAEVSSCRSLLEAAESLDIL